MKKKESTAQTVLIVRDPVRRLGLISLLDENPDVEIVGSGGDLLSALGSLSTPEDEIDILVVDGDHDRWAEPSYWATIRLIVSPSVRIVALCTNLERRQLEMLAAIGVTALHLADQEPERLSQAISNATHGIVDYDTDLLDDLRQVLMNPKYETMHDSSDVEFIPDKGIIFIRGREIRLTPRELEVIGLVSQGLTNRQIGNELSITERTVGFHISNLLEKMNVSSRTKLVAVVRMIELIYSEIRFPKHKGL